MKKPPTIANGFFSAADWVNGYQIAVTIKEAQKKITLNFIIIFLSEFFGFTAKKISEATNTIESSINMIFYSNEKLSGPGVFYKTILKNFQICFREDFFYNRN